MAEPAETVAVVVVTHNRADLLARMLDALVLQTYPIATVIVVDNASGDHTPQVLAKIEDSGDLPLTMIRSEENVGGAGGFRIGMETAYGGGWDRIWLMDDDVVPAPDCLAVLMGVDAEHSDCLMCVREDLDGNLVEKSATSFDLRNPLAIKPKTSSVETTYGTRQAMPPLAEIEVVAFEGLLVRREVVEAVGLPDAEFFIFYDDADFALRARKAGFRIWAVRDAVLVRQLPFSQRHALDTWKGFYMYRNLFVVHFRHGENALVRAKPYAITAAVVALSPLRGGRAEAGNVIRAIRGARAMQRGRASGVVESGETTTPR
ncbi:MAG TPA: glycosyltransferase family 2 protein [Nocardioides sp.]|nr:glycosyltransferase family 2 protein [Nocardioides sp.]